MLRTFIIVSAALSIAGAARAAPVGVASHVSGKAEVRSGSGGAWKPLRLLQRLEAGDSVRCGAGGEVVVILFESAARFKIGAGGTGLVETDTVKGAQKATRVPAPGIRIAKAMVGSRSDAFIARPAQSHQRLTPQFPGWMPEGERRFEWTSISGAATYSLTLFDSKENVVWSARVSAPHAEYPAELPFFALGRPYVWRLSAFSQSGKPLPESRWGFVSFLSAQDAAQLTAEARELEASASHEPGDTTVLVLLAELYRSYGVLGKALEILEGPQMVNQPGILEAQEELYRQAGRCAQLFRPRAESP